MRPPTPSADHSINLDGTRNRMSDHKALLQRALEAIDTVTEELDEVRARQREPIAVVGMGCRFPGGVKSPDEYWKLLLDGRSGIGPIPTDRWDVEAFYDPDLATPGTMFTKQGGFLDSVDGFDAPFFRIAPREAATLDPQQRLLLECAWEALEDAAQPPDGLRDTRSGVFVGITTSDYARLLRIGRADSDVYSATGTALNAAAGRISFFLGLQGPCLAMDTACSSSLVAVHTACQSLRSGECDLALAGGVNVMLSPEPFALFSNWGMLSPDGECRAFDANASGFVRGEGCGVLVLKRLSDAEAAGDPVRAVVLGSAVNHDGASSGFSVPNGSAQVKAIRDAVARSGVEPHQVGFVEAHGTGTPIGDPIEIEALGEVYGRGRNSAEPLLLGSAKSSIGHLESAAGVAGLIKLILTVQHGELPPQTSYRSPNPRIDWDRVAVRVNESRRPWPAGYGRRVGGVSGFGFTGTNAHMVVASVESPSTPPSDRAHRILPLSARSDEALEAMADALARSLDGDDTPRLGDVERTLATGRARFHRRAVVVGEAREDIAERLRALAGGRPAPGVVRREVARNGPRVAFLFSGQGSQYPRMGLALRQAFPAFREAFDRCAEATASAGGPDLLEGLTADDDSIHATGMTQPAIFAVEHALAELYRSWGVTPAAVLGHSIGEFVAACTAGILTPDDAARLVTVRGRLMQGLPTGGGMVAAAVDPDLARELVEPFRDRISLAAINGPASVVLSGHLEALEQLGSVLDERGVKTIPLTVSHAFHSPLMEPIQDEWRAALEEVDFGRPTIPVASNLSGTLDPSAGTSAEYWSRHLREAVAFHPAVNALVDGGNDVLIELGPRPVLIRMAGDFVNREDVALVPTLRGRAGEATDALEGLGSLWTAGVEPDWEAVLAGAGRRIGLPTYPFQRVRHWAAGRPPPPPGPGRRSTGHPESPEPGSHPFLSRRFESPVSGHQFECVLDPAAEPVLLEHRITGMVVFPASGYIELVGAAARELLGDRPVRLLDGRFSAALVLHTDGSEPPRNVVLLVGSEEAEPTFALHSRPSAGTGEWIEHAAGRLASAPPPPPGGSDPETRQRDGDAVSIEDYRAKMEAMGLEYGPSFLGLVRAYRADGAAWGVVRLPDSSTVDGFGIHPGLLDAAFHLIGLAVEGEEDRILLPVGFRAVDLYREAGREVRVHCRIRSPDFGGVEVDVTLTTPEGAPVARIEGLRTSKLSPAEFERAVGARKRTPLLVLDWVPWEPGPDGPKPDVGSWLVLSDHAGDGVTAVVEALRAAGGEASLLVCPDAADIVEALNDREHAPDGILDLRPAALGGDPAGPAPGESPGPAEPVVDAAQPLLTGPAGKVVELLGRVAQDAPYAAHRLVVVTSRAQAVQPGDRIMPPASAVWGFAASADAELPSCELALVDTDESAPDPGALVRAVVDASRETRLAVRGDALFAARLRNTSTGDLPDPPYALSRTTGSDFSTLALIPSGHPPVGPGQVGIEVLASGLNFRDVLNVLDMYPGEPGPLGNECCGRVVEVGAGVDHVRVGDLVACIATATFDSHVVAEAELVFEVPNGLSIAQAAVFPIAQLTAFLALRHLGNVQSGDRVLIHAGTGGVGLAAIHIARAYGAEVLATAGSEEKRQVLREMGVRHVWSSREVVPHQEVLAATQGRGVDLLLNSLVGEAIDEGIRSLAPMGRFLEIGQRELRTREQVSRIRDDVSYTAFLLGDWCARQPDVVREMWQELMELLSRGSIPAPIVRRFPLHGVEDAFRLMARARHVGRIAVMHRGSGGRHVRGGCTYVVTGGLGSLGLDTVEWLAEHGADCFILLGRTAPGEAAAARLAALEARGIAIRVAAVDVADPVALRWALEGIEPPIRGVVHAAGVRDDAALPGQDPDRIRRVFLPKADGARLVVEALGETDLDFLVLYSSGSAILGARGQASYAAASAFLDGYAHRLSREGRAAVSIGWGPWLGSGMASDVDGRTLDAWRASGIEMLERSEALACLDRAIGSTRPHLLALPIRWGQLFAAMGRVPPFLSLLGGKPPPLRSPDPPGRGARFDPDELGGMAPDQRRASLASYVGDVMSAVLGVSREAFDQYRDIGSMGLDSLMAIEIRNRIEGDLGVILPTATLFEVRQAAEVADVIDGLLGSSVVTTLGDDMIEGEI